MADTGCSGCRFEKPRILEAITPVITLWTACGTQWRRDSGIAYGLDYPAMYRVAESLGIAVDALVFTGIRYLEHEVLEMKGGAHG